MEQNWKRKQTDIKLKEHDINGVTYLTFPALDAVGTVVHAFSTRLGGVSEGQYASMNFTFTRGDDPEHVMENYRRMAEALEVDVSKMVLSYQTHTTNVRKVMAADAGFGIVKDREYQDVDGLITDVPGITLVTFYADCVPLYIVDPVRRAIGLSHSGWRGTVGRMGQVTVEAMTREYGSRPEDLLVGIGPSICKECFEVGEEVVAAFDKGFAEQYRDDLSYVKDNGKYQLDLWLANRIIFEEAGVPSGQIYTTDICTHCNPDLLFSHRTAGDRRGNLAAFLGLKA